MHRTYIITKEELSKWVDKLFIEEMSQHIQELKVL